jgi:tRNA A-37 threonylcarbamoyl transferase component Bud32/tetratricopeptide (TPR) repeat protein
MNSSDPRARAKQVLEDLSEHEREREALSEELRKQSKADEESLLLGGLAAELKLIRPDQLQEALRQQQEIRDRGQEARLGEILVQQGWLTTENLVRLLQQQERSLEGFPHLPRYRIEKRLGQGASAVVYRALDRELNRPVALKVLRDTGGISEVARQRFRREARAAAGLIHPNLIAVHDVGEDRDQLYIVMELVEGRPLSEILREDRSEGPTLLLLLEKVARGVAAAHEKRIVHRDLKPANILVTASGEPKVGDFGLAHLVDSKTELTKTGTTLGTPLYMSPEQVEGRSKEITRRTDVYALGAILYEILTGRPPHVGETVTELYGKIVREEPVPPRALNPRVSSDLQTITLKCLDKDPSPRYADAGEVAEDLRRYLGGEPIRGRPASLTNRAFKKVRRNALAYGLGAGMVLAATIALGVWLLGSVRAKRLEEERQRERDAAVLMMRETARVSLEAALRLRRKGATRSEMWTFMTTLLDTYQQAAERAPDVAEVDYLMGRMWRVMMEPWEALKHQERALSKEPDYAPALYERAILMSNQYGLEVSMQMAGTGKAPVPPEGPESTLGNETITQPDLARRREGIVRDCETFERLLAGAPEDLWPVRLGEANVLAARGILAYNEGKYQEAQSALEKAVEKDPTLEEAWETLAWSAQGQASSLSGTAWEQKWNEADE